MYATLHGWMWPGWITCLPGAPARLPRRRGCRPRATPRRRGGPASGARRPAPRYFSGIVALPISVSTPPITPLPAMRASNSISLQEELELLGPALGRDLDAHRLGEVVDAEHDVLHRRVLHDLGRDLERLGMLDHRLDGDAVVEAASRPTGRGSPARRMPRPPWRGSRRRRCRQVADQLPCPSRTRRCGTG